jgi:hypothetical protein
VNVLDLQQQFIDGLARLETGALSDEELSEAAVGLLRGGRQIAAQVARVTAAYDGRRIWASDGSKTAAARLARETKSSPGEMRKQVRDARRLRLMPKVDAALAAGEIGVEHARLLGRLAASDRKVIADAFPGAEDELVGFATTLSFKDFERALKYWE